MAIKKDLISVIIPAYNHAAYVREALESVFQQTYPHVELIIVNDASNDNTRCVIEDYLPSIRDRFTRVVFINNKTNQGISASLNIAIARSSANFFTCLSSDDKYSLEFIDKLYSKIIQNDEYGLVVGDNYIIDCKGKTCYWNTVRKCCYEDSKNTYTTFVDWLSRRSDISWTLPNFGSYHSLLKGNYIPNGYLIRKKFFDQIGGYSTQAPLEDYYLMLQLSKVCTMVYINSPIYYYRWHDNNSIKMKNIMYGYALKNLKLEKRYAINKGFRYIFYKVYIKTVCKYLLFTIRNCFKKILY